MGDRTRLPLPEPAKPPCPRCNGWNEKWEGTYTSDQMLAYSDAECAELRERVKVLEGLLRMIRSNLTYRFPSSSTLLVVEISAALEDE